MSTRPSFQFYPADWRNNSKLGRCTPAARGAWIDVLCVLHDEDEYGVARYSLKELALAARVPIKLVRELADKGVLKGAHSGPVEYRWAPFHAGKLGPEVVLVDAQGPTWYCSRFVKDEYKRQRRGESTRFDSESNPRPKQAPKTAPKTAPKAAIGEPEGYGASSSSSSSIALDASKQAPENSKPTDAGRACRLMREAGCVSTNPSHPALLAALEAGVTPEVLADTVREAIDRGKPNAFAWAIATAHGRLEEPQTPHTTRPATGPPHAPMSKTRAAIERLQSMKIPEDTADGNPDLDAQRVDGRPQQAALPAAR